MILTVFLNSTFVASEGIGRSWALISMAAEDLSVDFFESGRCGFDGAGVLAVGSRGLLLLGLWMRADLVGLASGSSAGSAIERIPTSKLRSKVFLAPVGLLSMSVALPCARPSFTVTSPVRMSPPTLIEVPPLRITAKFALPSL